MIPNKKLKRKVFGFIIQQNEEGDRSLLVYHCVPGVQYRFVGGNVDEGEELIEALYREIYEESGLEELTLVKKLGVQNYYKEFIDANVERHDYLLVPNKYLPQGWEHKCSGEGGDHGEVFRYQWITSNELDQIDIEFRNHVREEYKQDIFEGFNKERVSIT